jgi:predicted phage terminase large subunit-like protein
MNVSDRQTLDAILRSDFCAFLHRCVQTLNPGSKFLLNWHINTIAYELQRIINGGNTRLIVNLPPRYLKSTIISVAFPAFLLGHEPTRRIICISYSEELAAKHAADFRSIVESAWYRRIFPKMRLARTTDMEVLTTARGYRKATSVGGTLTGLGGDMFIIDDAQKPIDAQSDVRRDRLNHWFSNTLISRLDNKRTSGIVIVMQRVHLQDLVGYLTDQSDEWKVLSLSAIAEIDEMVAVTETLFQKRRAGEALHPEHESIETLERLREAMAPDDFAAQYQQWPVPPGGGMIRSEWLRYYDEVPDRMMATKVLISLDTASKTGVQNDWSVATVWYVVKGCYYLVDMLRGRFEYPSLRAGLLTLAKRHQPTSILIEDTGVGTALGQELQAAAHYSVNLVAVHGDKISRLYVQQHKFATGLVLFPRNGYFMPEVERELLTFPQGKTDDIVDTISQALDYRGYGFDRTYSGFQD